MQLKTLWSKLYWHVQPVSVRTGPVAVAVHA
jgi:hypothetical protein